MALFKEFESQGNFLFRHRSYLPLIIIIVGLAVYLNEEMMEMGNAIDCRKYLDFLMDDKIYFAVGLLGVLIRAITVGYSADNTSGRNTKVGQVADSINTTGIYSMLRHPLYLGNFFMWLAVALLTENFWFVISFILLYIVYYERIMYAEEAFLRNKFGDAYTDWSAHTPAIIPSTKNYVKSVNSFDLKKVLKKEKNGILALFLLFWIFDLSGDLLEGEGFEYNIWFYGVVVTLFYYLVMKLLKIMKLY